MSDPRSQAVVVMPSLGRCCQEVFSGRRLQAIVVMPSLSVVVKSSSGLHRQAVVV